MAVAFDAKATAWNSADGLNQETDNGTSCSASTGFSVGVSASLLVGVITCQNSSSADPGVISSWTWDGAAATAILQAGVGISGARQIRTAIAWWVSPATGTKVMTANWLNPSDAYMGPVSFTGVDTTTPVVTADNVTGTAGTTVTITSDANGATLAAWGDDGATPTVNFNKIYAEAPLDPAGAATYQLGGSSNGHTFTGAGAAISWAGIHIQAAAGGGGGGDVIPSAVIPIARRFIGWTAASILSRGRNASPAFHGPAWRAAAHHRGVRFIPAGADHNRCAR